MKKLSAIVLAIVIAFSCVGLFANASAAQAPVISSFKVGAGKEESANDISAISWWKSEETGIYYIFLPTYAKTSAITVWFDASAPVYVDGTEITSGAKTSAFDGKTSGVITCDGQEFNYCVLTSENMPAMYITTESGSLDAIHADKSHKEPGKIKIIKENGKNELDETTLDYIKGRGNSTWGFPKKPYNIKLSSKENLFKMGKSKKWSLIANYDDTALIRNLVVYSVCAQAGLEYTIKCIPLDLYINNEYAGNYLLTSRIEPDKNRVNINDLDKANENANEGIDIEALPQGGTYGTFSGYMPGSIKYIDILNDPDDISGGYILEQEIAARYTDELSGFVTVKGQPVNIKSPEYATKKEVEYIAGLYQKLEEALYSSNGRTSKGYHYSRFIDVNSLADMYIINEWTSNIDAGLTSSYLYKPEGDIKLYAGPAWDYDNAFDYYQTQRYGIPFNDPTKWSSCYTILYRNTIWGSDEIKTVPTIYNLVSKKADFQEVLVERWNTIFKDIIAEWNNVTINEKADMIRKSAIMNNIRWNMYKTEDLEKVEAGFNAEVARIIEFSSTKAATIDAGVGTVQPLPDTMKSNIFLDIYRKVLSSANDAVISLIKGFGLENVDFKAKLNSIGEKLGF